MVEIISKLIDTTTIYQIFHHHHINRLNHIAKKLLNFHRLNSYITNIYYIYYIYYNFFNIKIIINIYLMNLKNLNHDVLIIIDNYINIICHTCYKKIKFFFHNYKKQNKFYYCSNTCYNFF